MWAREGTRSESAARGRRRQRQRQRQRQRGEGEGARGRAQGLSTGSAGGSLGDAVDAVVQWVQRQCRKSRRTRRRAWSLSSIGLLKHAEGRGAEAGGDQGESRDVEGGDGRESSERAASCAANEGAHESSLAAAGLPHSPTHRREQHLDCSRSRQLFEKAGQLPRLGCGQRAASQPPSSLVLHCAQRKTARSAASLQSPSCQLHVARRPSPRPLAARAP